MTYSFWVERRDRPPLRMELDFNPPAPASRYPRFEDHAHRYVVESRWCLECGAAMNPQMAGVVSLMDDTIERLMGPTSDPR